MHTHTHSRETTHGHGHGTVGQAPSLKERRVFFVSDMHLLNICGAFAALHFTSTWICKIAGPDTDRDRDGDRDGAATQTQIRVARVAQLQVASCKLDLISCRSSLRIRFPAKRRGERRAQLVAGTGRGLSCILTYS